VSAPADLLASLARLRDATGALRFLPPVRYVYPPLDYAWLVHAEYARRFATPPKRVLFLGMNPGPFGMAQTGIPFGEVATVRDWLGLAAPVGRPPEEHPKRPVQGFACTRSEVSGRRLWGLFRARFGTAEAFFRGHYVANYCPLAFLSASGANLTPDRLSGPPLPALLTACDAHLRELLDLLRPTHRVGIGRFAAARLRVAAPGLPVVETLHPSPASPAANRDWAGTFTRQLEAAGVW
jgi:single-strand selective monofunctional uracil DNA glycosylase